MKLGKLPPRDDPRTLLLATYLPPHATPRPPDSVDYGRGVNWRMFKNDEVGDCTCATAGHMIQGWTKNAQGEAVAVKDADIIRAYSEITGYDGSPGSDNGAVALDVLKHWRRVGVGGHRIAGFVRVDHTKLWQVMTALYLFGGLYCGAALPKTAQRQHDLWAVENPDLVGDAAPGSWGGHAFHVDSYEPRWLRNVTWARRVRITWSWWKAYIDETYAILSPDWISRVTQKAPPGFNVEQLQADLAAVGR